MSQRQGWTTTFHQILFADDRHGWITGDTTMLRTTDGGISWQSSPLPVSGRMLFVDSLRGWCVQGSSYGGPGSIYRTDDAGGHWIQQCSTANPLMTVDFIDHLRGWAAGISSDLWRTTDGGVHWDLLYADCDLYVTSLNFINSEEGWAGTDNAVIHTTDGGSTWTRQRQGWCEGVQFVDGNHGFASTGYRVICTTDGGKSWGQARLPSAFKDECPVTGIFFKNSNEGIIAGEYALVYTDDGGVHTGIECAPTPSGGMWSVCMLANGDIWGIDGSCIVRRTGAFGPTAVERSPGISSPTQFMLEQNYPNPFNPTTRIQFTIVNRQLTIVKVYDVLGREVATVLNEVMPPGLHTVEFDGNNLASGVYFYRLTSGDYTATKRLILLK